MEIEIFNGPKGEFIKLVPTEGSFTLTNLVRFIDSKDPKDSSLKEAPNTYDTLVIHSDEYSGVADFFIEGFLIYCIHFSEKFGYTKILLHNPPAKILNQIESANLKLEIEIINYEYPRLELGNLSKIKSDFDNVIYGQNNAKDELLRTLYSLTNDGVHKPTVVMLYGPSSVGKTETAKFVSEILNPNQKLFRKQLSMFHNEKEIKEKLGDPIFSRFNHFIKYVELSNEAKEAIIEAVYDEELLKFNDEDIEIIKGWDIKDKLKGKISSLENAREIRKIMIQMMTYPLIEKL
ncbi:ATP-dependent Clp protease ATP-binding subunit [Bacillus mycoides]|uniref:ATP-dependent Clp protease ATP-binding subunit n=1 Tax=Bacillus mycoides TaxID=1405 RepID=UPI002E1B610B|nr:ATP-dependent Clp protease ATP-binding subunit [Bacillus mycoides]